MGKVIMKLILESVITSGNKTSFAKSDKFEETYLRLFVKDRNKVLKI